MLCITPVAAQAQPATGSGADAIAVSPVAAEEAGSGSRGERLGTAAPTRLLRTLNASPRRAICWVFGEDCREAVAVARCESTMRPTAQNGQYLGLFQMGSWERSLFGHGQTPLEQARAAHRYFVRSGSDWSPWTCKPWW